MLGTVAEKTRSRDWPAGTEKLPIHVRIEPEIEGSVIAEPLNDAVPARYVTAAGDVGSVSTTSSIVTSTEPLFVSRSV